MILDIESLQNNKYNSVGIILPEKYGGNWPSKKTCTGGFIKSSLVVSGSADYADKFSLGGEILDAAGKAQAITGMGGSQVGTKTYEQTKAQFQGTNIPTFSIPIVLIATQPSHDVRKEGVRILYSVFPTGDDIVSAPFNWQGKDTTDTCGLYIGTWFKIPTGLLITSVDVTYSQEVIENGTPLYAEVTVAMRYWMQPKADELAKWHGQTPLNLGTTAGKK